MANAQHLAQLYDHLKQKVRIVDNSEAAELENSLSTYTRRVWPIIDPADYMHNWHIDCISEYLEAVTAGQIKRLLINIPPRYMKSILGSVTWPTWMWTKRPEAKWIFASYAQSLSTKHSVDRRLILQSDWYRRNWGDRFYLLGDQNVKTEYQNNKNGVMVATSVGGTMTGKGADYIIVDDPHNPEEIDSDTIRASTIEWFRRTLPTRLNNKKTGAIVVIMQRLHENDLSGHIIEQGGYEHLKLPGENHKQIIIHYPMSGRDKIREAGELLWPEREGPEEIAAVKRALGSYNYGAQYDQDPTPSEGGMFKRTWWKFWAPEGMELPPVEIRIGSQVMYKTAEPLPKRFDQQLQSWDCTFKDSDGSDFVAGQVWGRKAADKYLLDQVKDRMDIIRTMDEIVRLRTKYPKARLVLVEDKANGPAVIQMLRRKVSGMVAVNPEGGKVARASAVAPEIEAGNVYLPHPMIAPWVTDYMNVFSGFPNILHDDEVDSTTQALNRLMYNNGEQPDDDDQYEPDYGTPIGRTGY
ncbi:phage terminase large subunit [Gorillibacterium sp. sgz5001074]|uniref:phage terminase large subunit n=1 Tax=Gorillibacterium sp. sgz5001074 TaxID=3446695 RepID=UPI003F665484